MIHGCHRFLKCFPKASKNYMTFSNRNPQSHAGQANQVTRAISIKIGGLYSIPSFSHSCISWQTFPHQDYFQRMGSKNSLRSAITERKHLYFGKIIETKIHSRHWHPALSSLSGENKRFLVSINVPIPSVTYPFDLFDLQSTILAYREMFFADCQV